MGRGWGEGIFLYKIKLQGIDIMYIIEYVQKFELKINKYFLFVKDMGEGLFLNKICKLEFKFRVFEYI